MKVVVPFVLILSLSACAEGLKMQPPADAPVDAVQADQTRPVARPATVRGAAVKPPSTARTVEDFDTTTREERAAAAAAPAEPAGERALGSTVASLGDPTRPGFWLETPLVAAETQGRVRFPGSGKSAQVTLIPIDGPATGGSRISLAAMRLIEAPLTDLPTIDVFAGG